MYKSSLMKLWDGGKLVGLTVSQETAGADPLDEFEQEILRIFNENARLKAEIKELKEEVVRIQTSINMALHPERRSY